MTDRPPGPIGYYVHHQGRGHERRYDAIRSIIGDDLQAVTQLGMRDPSPNSVVLPSDEVDGSPIDPTSGGVLHWAPLDVSTGAPRLARFAGFLDEHRPFGVVVDVSVEAALTCRLAGVPVVYVRQHGDRGDIAHEFAYRSARRLLAPWPEALEDPNTPGWVVAKTDYSGFVVEARPLNPSATVAGPGDIVAVSGAGGGSVSPDVIVALAETTGRRVFCAGPYPVGTLRRPRCGQVVDVGWTDDLPELLSGGAVVVATAGDNTVALAATNGCALITTPMPRPFDEQHAHARRLDETRVAVCIDSPEAISDWRPIVAAAEDRRDALRSLARPGGAARAAAAILAAFSDGP